jgi:uncharacterized protein (TIGR02611 family)
MTGKALTVFDDRADDEGERQAEQHPHNRSHEHPRQHVSSGRRRLCASYENRQWFAERPWARLKRKTGTGARQSRARPWLAGRPDTYGKTVSSRPSESVREKTHAPEAPTTRSGRLRARVRSWPGGFVLWRIGITLLGVGIILVGVVLLPLPGPGWLIIFAGIGLLGTEYAWAARLLAAVRSRVTAWTNWTRAQSRSVRLVIGALGLLALAVVVVGGLVVYGVL